MNRRFGRIFIPDTRDKLFPLEPDFGRAAFMISSGERIRRGWWIEKILDQMNTPRCVGYSGYTYLTAGPVRNLNLSITPHDVYKGAQANDEWPGDNYDGSSVRGCFKWLKKEGYVSEYRWIWDVETLAAEILTHGPVVVGTNWYSGMMNPFLGKVKPTGYVLGGHAYVLANVQMDRRRFGIVNSWGEDWGYKGRAWIKFDHFQQLLDENGEACTAIEVKKDE